MKPENFCFASKKADAPIKLIDFGLSALATRGTSLRGRVHMSHTLASECGRYGSRGSGRLCSRDRDCIADDEMFEKVGTAVYAAPEVHAACKPGLLQGGRAYGQQVCAYSVRSGNTGSRMLTVSVMAPWP